MMESEARWLRTLTIRVGANAFVGGLIFAFVAAFCLGMLGYAMGRALDEAALGNILNYYHRYAAEGADFGVAAGALSGVVGAFIFGVAALQPTPRYFAPIRALAGRVALGQILGTLGATICFLLYEYIRARWHGQRLALDVSADISWLVYGAPALMLCGAIAGALWKRDT